MKIHSMFKRLGCAACALVLMHACQSLDDPDGNVPVISSDIVTSTSVGSRYATIGIKEAVLNNDGREYEYYIKYSEQSTLGDDASIVKMSEYYEDNFWFYLSNLKPGTQYHYALCVRNNSDQYEVQGKVMTFTTTLAMSIASVDSLGWDEKTTVKFPADSRYANEMGALIAQRKDVDADFVYGSSFNVRLTRSFADDEETWSLPREYEFDGGMQYKVAAYSPYSKEVSPKGVEDLYVSVLEPSSYPLWGESDVITGDNPQAGITMKNMMAKIVLNFRSKASRSRNITSLYLFNAGRKMAGYGWFNVKTGTFTYPQEAYGYDIIANQVSGEKSFTLPSGESRTCEFMALPGKFGSQDVQLNAYFDSKSVLSAFLEGTEWESGKTYTYEVTVDDIKLSVSRIYTGITEWQDGGTSDEINVGGKEQEVENIYGHDAVDLGLPSGTKWATCNLGASSPEEAGDYYAWGETSPKSTFTIDNYADKNAIYNGKYNTFPDDISKTNYDVAYKTWGLGSNKAVSRTIVLKFASWCMPTKANVEELITYCKWQSYTLNGVKGIKVTGANGNYIFLPPTGWKSSSFDTGIANESLSFFWTSTINPDDKRFAWYVFNGALNDGMVRYCGLPIRPVYVSYTIK